MTRHEVIVAEIVARLIASGAVAAGRVLRDRGVAIAATDLPAIDVRIERSDTQEFGSKALRHDLLVRVDVVARATGGAAPSTVADGVVAVAHRAITSDETLGGRARSVRLERQDWRYEGSGDETIVVVEQQYRAAHVTRAGDLAAHAV